MVIMQLQITGHRAKMFLHDRDHLTRRGPQHYARLQSDYNSKSAQGAERAHTGHDQNALFQLEEVGNGP